MCVHAGCLNKDLSSHLIYQENLHILPLNNINKQSLHRWKQQLQNSFLLTSARRERAWTLYIEGADAETIEDGTTDVSERGKNN